MDDSVSKRLVVFYRAHRDKIFLVIAIVIVAVGTGFYLRQQRVPSIPKRVAGIVREGNVDSCKVIKGKTVNGVDYYTVCVNNVARKLALEKRDPAYCEQLDGALMKVDKCKEDVALVVSAVERKPSACDSLTGDRKTTCLNDIVLQEFADGIDTSACNAFADIAQKMMCRRDTALRAVATSPNTETCSRLQGSFKSDCKEMKDFVLHPDEAQCDILDSLEFQEACDVIIMSRNAAFEE